MNPLGTLKGRGFLDNTTDDEALFTELASGQQSVYAGFDTTAPSLHVGHLLPIMALAHLQRANHRPILLVGGATGMIGDPSGRSTERGLLTPEVVERNVEGIGAQVARFLDFDGPQAARIVNNADWIGPISHLEWLRDVGKHFTVPYMLAKESVRSRLEQGVSYTEFSYMLLQAYDFLHLFRTHGCRIQCGGSEQWGNITAGIDLIRRVEGKQAFGMTFRLLTTSSGEKFGKSAGNAVWLDANATTPFAFHQYWLNTADSEVGALLRLFTFLDIEAIDDLMNEHQRTPERHEAQAALADEVTRMVHGADGLDRAMRAKRVFFDLDVERLTVEDLEAAIGDIPVSRIKRADFDGGLPADQALATSGLTASKSEARRLIAAGGVYLNGVPLKEPNQRILSSDAIGPYIFLRVGKRNPCVIVIEG